MAVRSTDGPRRLGVGSIPLILSVLALVCALSYPQVMRRALRLRVEHAVAAVQTVVDATERFHTEVGGWPDASGPGETAGGLAPYLPEGFAFDQNGYRLALRVWETPEEGPPRRPASAGPGQAPVDITSTPPGPPFGSFRGVTVRSSDPRVLAGLLDRFGVARSFIYNGTWTLVFAWSPGG